MLGSRAQPAPNPCNPITSEFTAMVGLAGSLCGVLAIGCDADGSPVTSRCVTRWEKSLTWSPEFQE